MRLLVTQLTNEATDVVGVELRSADGADLPVFAAGAHVGLALPGGLQRQYSLVNSPSERHRYVLGVGLAPASRGGLPLRSRATGGGGRCSSERAQGTIWAGA